MASWTYCGIPRLSAAERELHQSVVFLCAKQESHRWVVSDRHHILSIPSDVGVELAQMFVAEFIHFEFDEHVALEDAVIENDIHEATCLTNEDALLPRLEAKAVAQLQQKVLQLVEKRVFKIGLAHGLLRFQTEKLEHVGIADGQLRLCLFGGAWARVASFSLLVESPERSK